MATATGTITDNDTVAATVTANQTTIVEGSDATFTVDLGAGDVAGSEDVVVTYHTDPDSGDNPAADSDDYEAPDGTLIIPAGPDHGDDRDNDESRRPAGRRRDPEGDSQSSDVQTRAR